MPEVLRLLRLRLLLAFLVSHALPEYALIRTRRPVSGVLVVDVEAAIVLALEAPRTVEHGTPQILDAAPTRAKLPPLANVRKPHGGDAGELVGQERRRGRADLLVL